MADMIVGVDPHKASNTIAVLDRDGTLVMGYRFENTAEGMTAMVAAVDGFGDRVWAVEGANGIGRSVAQRLVAAGETVIDVPCGVRDPALGATSPPSSLLAGRGRS